MKVGIYKGKESVTVENLPIPEVGDGDVLIKNEYSSICGTDIAVFRKGPDTGHKIEVGGEFGHETVSRVAKIGRNVTDFEVGDVVYPYPRYAKGDTSKAGVIGGFSEYILIPDAKLNHSLYRVPPEIDIKTASLIEPFTVGCRAARRSQPKRGENAIVFGCGTIGIAAAIALKHFGCDKVMVCDLSDLRLDIASELGFATCNLNSDTFPERAADVFGNGTGLGGKCVPDADIFIDAVGSETVMDTFVQHGKIGSRIVLVAVNNAKREMDFLHLTYAQKSVIGSGGYMPEDVATVFEIMRSGTWEIGKIITDEYPIDRLADAIRRAADYDNAFNVVINFNL